MSFGFKLSDLGLITNLAHSTVQNAKKACGAHSALAREVNSLHVVLTRLEAEVARPESILSGDESDEKGQELADLVEDCGRVLRVLKEILEKYNALSDEKRSVQKLWQKVKFGNGEMQDLDKIRSELATYTQAITLSLNLVGLGSQGKVERYMSSHSDELREIKASLNWVTAKMQVKEGSMHGEKSILSSYNGDDKEVWKLFRRELIHDGFSSKSLRKHKETIKSYVMELGERGVLDEEIPEAVVADGSAEDLPDTKEVVKEGIIDHQVTEPATPQRDKSSRGLPVADPNIVSPPSPPPARKSSRRYTVGDNFVSPPPPPPPRSPPARWPSLQTVSSGPPPPPQPPAAAEFVRSKPVPSGLKTQDYPRHEPMPALPRATTFQSGDRGRDRVIYRGRTEVTSDSEPDSPIHPLPRHSYSPEKTIAIEQSKAKEVIEGSSPHRASSNLRRGDFTSEWSASSDPAKLQYPDKALGPKPELQDFPWSRSLGGSYRIDEGKSAGGAVRGQTSASLKSASGSASAGPSDDSADEAITALPLVEEKFDAFHEIKLDDIGPMLDLSFDTGTNDSKPSSEFGAGWGSSWTIGTKGNLISSAATTATPPKELSQWRIASIPALVETPPVGPTPTPGPPRLKKKIPWKGKNIMVSLPWDDERGQKSKAPSLIDQKDVNAIVQDTKNATAGFDADNNPWTLNRKDSDMEYAGSSLEDSKDGEEEKMTNANGQEEEREDDFFEPPKRSWKKKTKKRQGTEVSADSYGIQSEQEFTPVPPITNDNEPKSREGGIKEIEESGRQTYAEMRKVINNVTIEGEVSRNIREMLSDVLSNNECLPNPRRETAGPSDQDGEAQPPKTDSNPFAPRNVPSPTPWATYRSPGPVVYATNQLSYAPDPIIEPRPIRARYSGGRYYPA